MRPTIRSSRSLESSFFHAHCQASSYPPAPVVMKVMVASRCGALKVLEREVRGRAAADVPRGLAPAGDMQRKEHALQPRAEPPISWSSGADAPTQRRYFFAGVTLKLRKRFTDNPSNGKEQSDPGSGVRGRSFEAGASPAREQRKTNAGRSRPVANTAGCSKRGRGPQGFCFRSGNDGACAGFLQPQE